MFRIMAKQTPLSFKITAVLLSALLMITVVLLGSCTPRSVSTTDTTSAVVTTSSTTTSTSTVTSLTTESSTSTITSPANMSTPPPFPVAFYGNVTINGQPAPVGTEVKAAGQGVTVNIPGCGNPLITIVAGQYGTLDPLGAKLLVQGNIPENTVISFYVNGILTDKTFNYSSSGAGAIQKLDLSITK